MSAVQNFLRPGEYGNECLVRTPKRCLALPPLLCRAVSLPFDASIGACENCAQRSDWACDLCKALPIEHKLVGRFAHIFNSDTQGLVERAIDTTPEWTRLTDRSLLGASTGKSRWVVAELAKKHAGPITKAKPKICWADKSCDAWRPGAGSAGQGSKAPPPTSGVPTGKTIVYSLYNSELYVALSELRRAGWSDAGSPFCQDFHTLAEHLIEAAEELGFSAELWPNQPLKLSDTGERLAPTGWYGLSRQQQRAATTLGLSHASWPPPEFGLELWRTRRPKFVVVATADEFKVGQKDNLARSQALRDFKTDSSIDVLIMDGVATVGHDLSCVTDVIAMEAIPQRGAWEQLVSRAYRMGAAVEQQITVSTLVYDGSPEHPILPDFAECWIPSAAPPAREAAESASVSS